MNKLRSECISGHLIINETDKLIIMRFRSKFIEQLKNFNYRNILCYIPHKMSTFYHFSVGET